MGYSYDVTVQSSVQFPCRCLMITSVARDNGERHHARFVTWCEKNNNIAIALSVLFVCLSLPNYTDTNNFGIPLQTKSPVN